MAHSAASRAVQAADALDRYLRSRPSAPAGTRPAMVEDDPAANSAIKNLVDAAGLGPAASAPPHPEAPFIAAETGIPGMPLQLAHTDWLHHRLTISGAAEAVHFFRERAAGAGTIPWLLDCDRMEEDWFLRLATAGPARISLEGARLLARQLRAAVERRHAMAASRVGRSTACPFDLHALVPLPGGILQLGPDHPHALAWLWQHWGTTEALRHVADEDATGRPSGSRNDGAWRLGFWSADWTPWRALSEIGAAWPMLRFEVQPTYDLLS